MVKQGLIVGIDYTTEYCQISYYSMRHNRPESVTTDSDVMRYLVPTALSYDVEGGRWLIGYSALENFQLTESELYDDFLRRSLKKEIVDLGNDSFEYVELFAIFMGKLVEMAKALAFEQKIYNVTVNMRNITLEIKEVMTDVFERIGIDEGKLKFLTCAESFAYFVLNEDKRLWERGSLLFDFSKEGFFARLFKLQRETDIGIVVVDETDYNIEFSTKDLASESSRNELDLKLSSLFEEIYAKYPVDSVYFAGSGFDELWFSDTLQNISEKIRAFKGNNLYVKGACHAGFRIMSEQKDFPICCNDRTTARITIDTKSGGQIKTVTVSEAFTSWHDAKGTIDLIIDNISWLTVKVASMLKKDVATLDFDLEEFPGRPNKATRIEVSVSYLNEHECKISVKDKGFGEFFESSDIVLEKEIDIDEFV